ncbi:beta-lactamase superfamily domain-containing protein [Massariosphaeria phaeospora]|uniref:Beta-lactamase superfamily domain-containing protein n=1 Tax=Massariosphaeria phaeospora TaxID=100035 RepID=A0A7C8MFQ1_9PLEO|nr:beta-lactamase superfamily domain-containing protein [Massariosphaeria phaeospora]
MRLQHLPFSAAIPLPLSSSMPPFSAPRLTFTAFRRLLRTSTAPTRGSRTRTSSSTREQQHYSSKRQPVFWKRYWQAPKFSTTAKMSSVGGMGVGSAALYAVVSNPAQMGARPDEAEEKKHHLKNGKGFINPWDSFKDFSPLSIGLQLIARKLRGDVHVPDTTPPTVPVRKPSLHATRSTPALRATWLGHACYYVEFPSGLRVLFDPVFEDCCSPINLKMLKRYTPPPCEIEDLPFVDLVVISHNHYDHLSYPTILRIKNKFPQAHFFAPLGNRKWFVDSGVPAERVTELDWWDQRDVKLDGGKAGQEKAVGVEQPGELTQREVEKAITATVGALPCQHVSARTPFDKCRTLWASWSVESGGAKVYFAGYVYSLSLSLHPSPSFLANPPPPSSDTGYRSVPAVPAGTDDYGPAYAHLPHCPAFAQIGTHRGPFDLGLIPIGAYEPRFVMSPMHANPTDSVHIFADTRCRRALGMHWGTWVLTEEDVMEPPRKLKDALREKGLGETGVFDVCDIGESREFECAGNGKGA